MIAGTSIQSETGTNHDERLEFPPVVAQNALGLFICASVKQIIGNHRSMYKLADVITYAAYSIAYSIALLN